MRKNQCTIIVAITIVIALLTPTTIEAQIANDRENYYGDRLRVSVDLQAKKGDDNSTVCIPGGTSMVVVGQGDKTLSVKLDVKEDAKTCDGKSSLSQSTAYEVTFDALHNSGATRTGITYGALVIPFKYQLSGEKDFTGSASLGGYVGYRFETLQAIGITATPILFMGASNISVQNSGKSSPDNVMGFSYGIGLVGTLKSSFQLGVVVGWDRVGNSVNYQYDGKPWIALEIGFAFLQ